MNMMKKLYWLIIVVLFTTGCASARMRNAVPMDLLDKTEVPDFQEIRAFDGQANNFFRKDMVTIFEQDNEQDKEGSIWAVNSNHDYAVLAISGGAANGAYGVGLLNGWSHQGSRPVFKVVTGVSTGAIIAPFAFIGSRYDEKLKDFYTKFSTREIMQSKGLLQVLFGDSIMSDRPLKHLIEENIDESLLREVAREYKKGRRLYVGTTNLDSQEFVIWDMGKIASIGNYQSLELFRKIILASVTIPIVFPPVYFDVEVNHQKYDEMHVDGGVSKQVFFLYNVLQGFEKAMIKNGVDMSSIKYSIYVIRNGYVDPVYKEVPDNIFAITSRTVETLTNAQGIGDIYQLYDFTKMRNGDFNLAYIPSTYIAKTKELFDLQEMQTLFNLGYARALRGYDWKKVPPGLNEED